ncbi:MAG: ankyrin repeat domain-containing protein [Chlamydiia bacterium]|nr:ankyrin repeat domain-containing protein [Chlamydiia bacterium]
MIPNASNQPTQSSTHTQHYNPYPLHAAAAHGTPNQVCDLFSQTPDINQRDQAQQTPLHVALGHGNLEAARVLVQLGADVNLQEARGFNALLISIANRLPVDWVEYFIDATNDLGTKTKDGVDALILAMDCGDPLIVQALLKRTMKMAPTLQKGSAHLNFAIDHAPWAVGLLLQGGANPNCIDAKHQTPLMRAAMQGNLALLNILLPYSKHEMVDSDHMTALMLCIRASASPGIIPTSIWDQCIELLLAKARGNLPLLNSVSSTLETPLGLAWLYRKIDLHYQLLRAGASSMGTAWTEERLASFIIQLLLHYLPTAQSASYVKQGISDHFDALLCSLRAQSNQQAVLDMAIGIVASLAKGSWCADPKARGPRNEAPPIRCCHNGQRKAQKWYLAMIREVLTDMSERLLTEGANVNATITGGKRPLDYWLACHEHSINAIRTLKKHGAKTSKSRLLPF